MRVFYWALDNLVYSAFLIAREVGPSVVQWLVPRTAFSELWAAFSDYFSLQFFKLIPYCRLLTINEFDVDRDVNVYFTIYPVITGCLLNVLFVPEAHEQHNIAALFDGLYSTHFYENMM